jgi:3-methyladenine DNA glycosylase AlkC
MSEHSGSHVANAALKDIFDAHCIQHFAEETAAVYASFDTTRFVTLCLTGLEALSVMQRMRHLAQCLRITLPAKFPKALYVLHDLAPRLNSGFVAMVLSEYVALYGAEEFNASMDALKHLTGFGSSEFAIRHFLQRDLQRTLTVMKRWSKDDDEHVRRLSSEGSRPRLPWSFRLEPLTEDPSLTLPILNNLLADDSGSVRKSVANHLNDITKDHPGWVLDRIESWSLDDSRTRWIAKHALRSLIKKGDKRALTIIGAGAMPKVLISAVRIDPLAVHLGDAITLSFRLKSTSKASQRLIIDYAIHYIKKSGGSSAKVFKLKALTLDAGVAVPIRCVQTIRNFTTRVHYAGRHQVDVIINGETLARRSFDLKLARRQDSCKKCS